MHDHKPTDSHNYLETLAILPAKRGAIYVTEVRHDDWCDLLRGTGHCNCNPDIVRRELVSENR